MIDIPVINERKKNYDILKAILLQYKDAMVLT